MSWTVLPFDLSKQFENAVGGKTVMVHVGHYAILEADAPETHLATGHTLVCAGVAMVPEDPRGNIGMMHIYSDPEHFEAGQDRITRHVREGWDKFQVALAPRGTYQAVLFGGRRPHESRAKPYQFQADMASQWTNDALKACASDAGFVTGAVDFQYQDGPHDAIISRPTREVVIGRHHDNILMKLARQYHAEKARLIYDRWTIS